MVRIYLLYFLSGLASLIYQIVWYRHFVDRLGASNITFVLVLCSFIGGIVLGIVGQIVTYFEPSLSLASYYFIFIVLLMVRPKGIMGK